MWLRHTAAEECKRAAAVVDLHSACRKEQQQQQQLYLLCLKPQSRLLVQMGKGRSVLPVGCLQGCAKGIVGMLHTYTLHTFSSMTTNKDSTCGLQIAFT